MDKMEKKSWSISLNQWKLLSGDWFLRIYNRNKKVIEIKNAALKEIGIKKKLQYGCIMCENYAESDEDCPLNDCYDGYHYTEWEDLLFEYYDFYEDIIYYGDYGYLELKEKYEIVKVAKKFYHELILMFIYRCSL